MSSYRPVPRALKSTPVPTFPGHREHLHAQEAGGHRLIKRTASSVTLRSSQVSKDWWKQTTHQRADGQPPHPCRGAQARRARERPNRPSGGDRNGWRFPGILPVGGLWFAQAAAVLRLHAPKQSGKSFFSRVLVLPYSGLVVFGACAAFRTLSISALTRFCRDDCGFNSTLPHKLHAVCGVHVDLLPRTTAVVGSNFAPATSRSANERVLVDFDMMFWFLPSARRRGNFLC